jgi:hypothetical protein
MGGPQSLEEVVECPMRQYRISTAMGFCLEVRGDESRVMVHSPILVDDVAVINLYTSIPLRSKTGKSAMK